MSGRILPPKIDSRMASDLLLRLRAMVPHYTSEWLAKDDDDPGVALLKIFSFMAEGVISRLNRAPERNFLAFLDMLGIRRLPATPARAPVRFLVAQGIEDEFMIPQGTQVSAPPAGGRPVELPFETTAELRAIPAALSALFALDPETDRIYKPPPGFLSLQLEASESPSLTVRAFSSAGSKSLQLDPPGQVQQGDFLRIEMPPGQATGPGAPCGALSSSMSRASQSNTIEHLVVADVKGPIVMLTEPLAHDYPEGTIVRKATRFELFEGKNFQEHVLYVAHAEYFNLESEAQVALVVEHALGSASNLQSLNIAWEFFGEKSKVDGWHPFEVKSDNSIGLSRDGRVVLMMPGKGTKAKIKETEINGSKSRWIRARLVDPIPAMMAEGLPRLESINLAVSREQEQGIPADQAFNNDTPLTVDVPFNPFGTEPRIFDRFYIASEEAFSKPGADVTLDIDLDFSNLLGAPAAIFREGKIRAFAHGAASRLMEFQIDLTKTTATVTTVNHQTPANVHLDSAAIPAVVEDSSLSSAGVFVKGDDGRMYLRLAPRTTQGSWRPLEPAPPGKVKFNPAAALRGRTWDLFVVVDGKVFVKVVDPINPMTPEPWNSLSNDFMASSTPFVIPPDSKSPPDSKRSRTWVLVTDQVGRTHLHDGVEWKDVTPKDAICQAAEGAHPVGFFEGMNEQVLRVYLRNKSDNLVVFEAKPEDAPGATHDFEDLGQPPGARLDSNPAVARTPVGVRVYVKGDDGQLWERDPSAKKWSERNKPSEFDLANDPVVLTNFQAGATGGDSFVSVLSTSNKNALLEFRIPTSTVVTGQLQAGPLEFIMLVDPLATDETFFVHIIDGPGSASSDDAVRKITSQPNAINLALLDKPLDRVTTDKTTYELLRQKETGHIQDADTDTVVLMDDTVAELGDFVFINGQLRELESVDDGTFTLRTNWKQLPSRSPAAEYVLLEIEDGPKAIQTGAAGRAVLAANSNPSRDFFKGFFLRITAGEGASPASKLITSYDDETRSVALAEDFDPSRPPTKDSAYQITEDKWLPNPVPDQTELRPELSWEYWNGKGWVSLPVGAHDDTTQNFLVPGQVKFRLPEDIAKTEVAGQENYWIRARITGGDYGQAVFFFDDAKKQVEIRKDSLRPPLIKNLTIFYQDTVGKPPQFCLTFNNLTFLDQTAANNTNDKNFRPYETLPEEQKALYLGFDKEFDGGPIRLYFAARELVVDERNKPKLLWEIASDNKWKPVATEDRTIALTGPEIVTWQVSDEFQQRQYFGEALFWVRATLTEGAWEKSPLLSGLFVNTVKAIQARTVLNEILGSSTGEKNESFRFQQLPVLPNEELRVRETLTEEERKQLVEAEGKDTVFEVRDQEDRVLETWVRWKEVQEFFASNQLSRHYRLDRASGELEFGDGVHGRIPPAGGDNIRAFSYQAGGGAAGNVAAGEINSLVTAVAGVESVINPSPAGGGSEAATPEQMLEIGPAQVSHRDRAVTPEDFERLAKEASREVRKARCLPNRNKAGRHEVGWTSVHLVPDSKDARPTPSFELRRAVGRYLADRADMSLVEQDHIFVGEAQYVPVDVEATIFAKSLDVSSTAERKVREALDRFLHPLTGGPVGEGWDFGRDLAASDLYFLLEEIEEVDHVGALSLHFGGTTSDEQVEVAPDALLAGGTHIVRVMIESRE